MTIARAEMKKGFAALWDSNQYSLPADMKAALQRGKDSEGGEVARLHFQINLESLAQTSSARIPLCGDTGLPMYYVVLGERVIDKIDGGLAALFEELREAVRRATVSVPMRRNVVDPITRQEHPDSVGEIVPFIDYRLEPGGRYLEVTAVALGGGPELTCQARILGAVEGVRGIKRFVIESVARTDAGTNCNPQVVGVGIGGTMDVASAFAKQAAILRPIGSRHPQVAIAALEEELTQTLNSLELGPWGLGGKTTVFDVHIEIAETHIATLPVSLYMQCPALRRATMRFYDDGRVEDGVENSWFRRTT